MAEKIAEIVWYKLNTKELFDKLQTGETGLSNAEAKIRLEKYGLNELKEGKKVSAFKIFIQQFKSLVIIILIIASIISIFVGERIEAIAILIIVIFAAILGFIQEYHASKAIESLKKLASPSAMAVRDKNEEEIDAKELVPGDLIILKAGDKVPADSRLIEINNLKTDEATLTGKSLPVEKQTEELEKEKLTVADRKNLVVHY